MESSERMIAALEGREVDRPPVFPQIGDHAGIIQGLTYDIMYQDAEAAATAHSNALDLYGYDITTIQVEPSWPVAEACGAEILYPPDKNPWITKYLVETEEDLGKLEIPDFSRTQSSKVMIEGTRILKQACEVPVAAFMTGPITFSLQLMPYQSLILRLSKKPDFVHKLVSKAVDVIKAYVRALKEAGADILVICEHDVQMLSPRHVEEFSLNYLPDILGIYKYNVLHMCGKVTPHLKYVAEHLKKLKDKGLNTLNVGPHVDIALTQELLDHELGIAGNIDHYELLPRGTPKNIESAVYDAIKASGGDTRYMVAPGCEITSDTPVENVKAFVNAAKTYRR